MTTFALSKACEWLPPRNAMRVRSMRLTNTTKTQRHEETPRNAYQESSNRISIRGSLRALDPL